MKTIIYTYQNKKPVFFELDRYYFVKNKRQMEQLIDRLLDIDAVTSPAEMKFPAVLELRAGFGPTLNIVSSKELVKAERALQKLQRKAKKSK